MGRMARREAFARASAAVLGATLPTVAGAERAVSKGRLRQSVSRWCYDKIPSREFYRAVADMGLTAVDLLEEAEWTVVREFGLVCSMGYGGGGTIESGLNVRSNHDAIVSALTASIPRAAKLGVPNLITFFGNRRGLPDAEAMRNCVDALVRLKPVAEDRGVTICVELLNSKVDHADYQGDRSAFGVDVVKAVGSPRVKLLYDIYHMQIMEGDVIRTIRREHDWIAHYHTGGVPGRHELDETQELNWRAVCTAIVDTGFSGFLAHEFVPTRDPLTSLRQAVALCDV